ncbi:MAG TPA: peptidoglycan DD-metalloendopeptidase family protein [Acidimicrobiia bacterium]|nr:peptidoglycan DD-metalloendopeptidase family protein [Acidimicrobiia bacterium]
MNQASRTIAALLVVTLALPAYAEITDDDIDRAREEVNAVLADSEALGIQVQEAWARQFALEKEISDLETSIELAQVRIAETETRLEEVAVEMYMGSARSASLQVLFSDETEGYEAGSEYLREVSGSDQDVVSQLRAFRSELERQTGRLAEASAEQETVTADLERMAGTLQGELAEAQAVYDRLLAQQEAEEQARRQAEEEARQEAEEAARNARTTTTSGGGGSGNGSTTTTVGDTGTTTTTPAPPQPSNGGACPMAGAVSFSDSYGEPRSGGRAHRGVDMIAARGTPIVAVYAGTITRLSTSALGGITLWLRAENGDQFYYAHLDSYGEIATGQSVPEGFVVGYNGSTGNAPAWLPHLHFEWHPGGGSAVNPYQLVRSLC